MYNGIPIELIKVIGSIIMILVVIYAIRHQDPPFSERINHDKEQARLMQESTSSRPRRRAKDPNTTILRNILWIDFLRFMRKK